MLKYLKIIIYITILILIILVSGFFIWLNSTLPNYNKNITSKYITEEVEIYRDSYDMPIIVAKNEADLSFGIGYAMAQDRLFQMDLIRRAIKGRLSEILGEELIRTDLFFSTLTAGRSLQEMKESYPPQLIQLIENFSNGVNHFIKEERLPIEFKLLGYKPEPWKPEDSLAVFYYMAYDLNTAYDTEILFYLLTQKLGYNKAKELYPDYIPQRGEILQAMNYKKNSHIEKELLSFLDSLDSAKRLFNSQRSGASNNWVIAPSRSETGTPIVASDMHLGFGLPGIWYEAHLITPENHISGLLLPGIPVVIVGMNEQIAWAFTNVMADDADFYIEQVNPQNTNQYLHRGMYKDFEILKKKFIINGKEKEYEILKTVHGPVVNSIIPFETDQIFSMKWTAYDHFLSAQALYELNKAKNINDIERATEFFKTPGQNWVYADKEGNIGFTAAVAIPIRPGFNGLLPMPGTGNYDWTGYVPTAQQPRLRNPASGWIATANNKHSSNYPYVISNYYHYPDRYERIKEILTSKEKLSIQDIKNLQADVKSLMAQEMVPIFLEDLKSKELPQNDLNEKVIKEWENWDYFCTKGSKACTIFHYFLRNLIYEVFEPHLGEAYLKQYIKKKFIVINALRIFLKDPNSPWFDNPETKDIIETRKDVIYTSFLKTLKQLEELGREENWLWSKIHTLTYEHPFGKNKFLRRYFNKGPFGVPGALSTVNPMNFPLDKNSLHFQVKDGASERYIMIPGNKNQSLRVIPTGISGNPASNGYGNQIPLFLNNQYREFNLNVDEVLKKTKSKLKIIKTNE